MLLDDILIQLKTVLEASAMRGSAVQGLGVDQNVTKSGTFPSKMI